jgi:hypothetical protein
MMDSSSLLNLVHYLTAVCWMKTEIIFFLFFKWMKVVTTCKQVTFQVVVEAFKEECRYLMTQYEEAQGKQRCKYLARVTNVSAAEKNTWLCEKFLTYIIWNVPKMSAQTSGVDFLH